MGEVGDVGYWILGYWDIGQEMNGLDIRILGEIDRYGQKLIGSA
jgi:hypothetical protein